MVLEKLHVRDFRNLRDVTFHPSPGLNAIHGFNGQGKTSVLEAIHFVSEGRTFRSTTPADLVRHGAAGLQVTARIRSNLGTIDHLRSSVMATKRILDLNERQRVPLGDYLGHLRVVIHSPEDAQLILGPPEVRRRFLNRILVLTEPGFFRTLSQYGRALRSRNRCLERRVPATETESWTDILIQLGARILAARVDLIARLTAELLPALARITAEASPISIRYHVGGEYDGGSLTEAAALALLREQSQRRASREDRLARTLFGPHLDDVRFVIESGLARRNASQGELRSILIGLRLSEHAVITSQTDDEPVFLLDDLSSELDEKRARRVIDAVTDLRGQTFVTGTQRQQGPVGARTFHMQAGVPTTDHPPPAPRPSPSC
jgi:DNA replication and repair protein RecF